MKFEWAIFDVDGVMTNGQLYYDKTGEVLKVFNVKDGHGIKLLRNLGIKCAVISGKGDASVEKRLKDLQFNDFIFQRNDKGSAMDELASRHGASIYNSFCVGDDLPDLEMFERCKFSFAVADAVPALKRKANFVLSKNGGEGAVREACEYIIAKGYSCD